MRVLLQRVTQASVSVAGAEIAGISQGLLVFVGIEPQDSAATVQKLVDKTLGLRIFPDAAKLMNRSVRDIAGEVLVVSQFTLAADTRKGKRPGFSTAAPPPLAESVYNSFLEQMHATYDSVQSGQFGADMQVALVNDGPVTFLLEA